MSEETRPRRNRRGRGRRDDARGAGAARSPEHRPRVSRRALEAAAAKRAAVEVPAIAYPAELPVSARREEIAAAIRDHQVVIVAGETGSGKTTQLPKICLELGRGRAGQIGHTQPRRIAARSVAERIAEEIGTELGGIVGYQVRFTDQSSDTTLVKVMTDGILLAQIQRDPDLLAYDTLIIDEAHERSLNIDFLLGYLTNLLPRRPDLKVVITSATIDSERFARHFAAGGPLPQPAQVDDAAVADERAHDPRMAPVVEVTGRTYPVEILYRPLEGATKGEEKDLVTGIVDACDELMTWGDGDVLVFLSGEREIRDAADGLEAHLGDRARGPRHPRRVEILPLYSRLSAAEQHRVFERHSARRIVLATNVAETSLTVPGIHYVVDPGTARISRYSKATKVQRLPIEPISQASARQRSGRAGRLADGIAIRLYSEEDFESRPAFTEPEILRTSLAAVLLQMISVGVVESPEDVARFPFVEPPDTRAIRDGVQLLSELGAISTAGGRTSLTAVGRQLSRLPIDPRQARMIVEGARHGVAREVAVIAAALSIQDPRERPAERREEADLLHRRFADPGSDLLSYLNLWEHVRERQHALSGNQFRRLCRSEMLNFLRIREWQDLVQQLREAAKSLDIAMAYRKPSPVEDPEGTGALRHVWDDDAIHRSILAGLLSQVGAQDVLQLKASSFSHLKGEARAKEMRRARKRASNEFIGARGIRFAISPGSPLSKKPPEFVMAAELVETSRLWARDVARIDPAWAEELAGDLAKRTYSEPHWSSRRGAAMATEKVLLYGVPIVADRPVLWAKVDREGARDLFIRHALVQGEWTTHHGFWRRNQRVLEEAAQVEARSRTRGVIADEDTLYGFYDARLPESIVSAAHFDRWWKGARLEDPELLTLTLDELVPDHAAVDPAEFPERWPQLDLELPLTYQFEPGTAADGVTVHVPVGVLARVIPEGFDWLVPGMLPELVTATIRALPKPVRRLLVPAPDAARDIVAWMGGNLPAWEDVVRAGDMAEPFREAFTRAVRDLRDVDIPDDAWDGLEERLPAHLRMTFRVVEPRGRGGDRILDESHDLVLLQRSLAPQAEAAVRTAVQRAADAAARGRGGRGRGDDAHGAAPAAVAAAAGGAGGPAPRPASAAVAEVESLTSWPDLEVLPDEVEGTVHGVVARGYPAIVEEKGPRAALRVLADETERDAAHARGVRRLLVAEVGLPVKRVTTRWSPAESLALGASPYRSTEALVDDLQMAAVATLAPGAGAVRDRASYEALRAEVRARLEDAVLDVARQAAAALTAARELDVAVRGATSLALLSTLQELREQSAALVGDGFVRATPADRLPHLARYLKAAAHRLEKARLDPAKDAQLAWQVSQVVEAYDTVRAARTKGRPDPATVAALDAVRWMVEELRVSLFAQRLGTDGPVSEQRIRKALAAIG
ncbi:ATP-dependent RNA helicase HrpA [Demequina sp. SYSU T00192]|uniref:ATP-dependent RNA helicase HrpA n=1 Tax=Demequina litoralis TaxID=3051660 RepID=A0ABT8GAN4_9MICO|nr:ATP-dependent RNA helicase HrpA [Demequina sp. SYSU T00192]MDN4476201.1 ATP-dependent RNA helicase HrpA [Demequina sp. SYSU T00192]